MLGYDLYGRPYIPPFEKYSGHKGLAGSPGADIGDAGSHLRHGLRELEDP